MIKSKVFKINQKVAHGFKRITTDMKPVFCSKIKNIIYGSRLAGVIFLTGLFLSLPGKGLGQALKAKATATPGTVCSGEAVQLDAGASGGSGSYTYAWTSSPLGFTSTIANPIANPTVNTTYSVTVDDGSGNVISDVAVVVNPFLPVSVSIADVPSGAICAGTSVTFTATLANGGATPSYQWKVNGVNAGTNSPTFSSTTLINNDVVSVVMTSNATCVTGNPATSNTVTMVVNPNLPASVSIAALPSGAICPGTSVTFTATPANGGTTPSYQWKVNGINAGTNSPTFSSTTLINNDVVSVVMTSNATCVSGNPATSNTITMVVNTNLPASVSIADAPSGAICAGTSVTFTATPVNGGTAPSYQWKLNGVNTGTNSPTFSSTTLINNDVVSVVMTSNATCVSGNPATSNTVTMVVNANLPAGVSIAAVPSGAVCAGTSVVFTATPTNGGTTPSYQWKVNGGNTGTNSPTFSSTTLANNDIVSVVMTSNATCVSGSPATSNTITMTINPNAGISLTSGAGTNLQTLCLNTSITTITYSITGGGTGAGVTGLPTGVNGVYSGGVFTISGTPSVSGTFNYTVTTTGTCTQATATGTITVNPNAVITLTSAAGTNLQTICLNAAITTITYSITGGGTGAGVTGLPAGVNGAFSGGVFTISGTPTAIGTFNYTLTTTGTCTQATSTGTITVNPNAAISLTSAAGTNLQTLCINTAITTITYSVSGGGTGAGVTGLPTGVSGVYSAGVFTISGTPSVSGTFNYTVTTTGTCTQTSATGTITVNPTAVITLTSAAGTNLQTVCLNTAMTNITYSITGGGTGAGVTGLPAGVNNVYSGGVFTISGTPTGTGTFNYTVTTTGTCTQATATGTITVNPNAGIALTSAAGTNLQTRCINTAITNITYSVSGSGTGAGVTGLPNGVNGVYNSGVFTISGIPSVSGTFNYTVTTTGTCIQATATGTLTINPLPVPTLSSSDPDNIICSGASVTFTAGGGTSYNFRLGGISVQSGTSPTYTTSSLINGQVVDVIVTNSNGCSATSPSIINFVNALPFIVITSPPACAPDLATYSLGVTVSTGTVTSTAGSVTNTGGNTWSIIGVLSGTNITVTVTDASGCQNNLVVTAPNCSCPSVAAPVSGGDKSYCASGTIPTISASVPSGQTVDWYDSSSAGTLLKGSSLTYTPTSAGTYYALARNTTTGCVSSTRTAVTVTMNALPIPTLTSSEADNTFCAGTSITFTAGGGTSYNFRVGGTSVQNGPSATYTTSLLTNGQVVDVIVTNAAGCNSTATGITNTVNALPTATLLSSDSDNKFCAGTSITFTGGGGTNYNFRVGGLSIQNGSSSTYVTSSISNGQVVDVIVTNANGCLATSAGITNTVYALPTPTLTSSDADNVFCAGTLVTFTATGGSNYDFRVDGVSKQAGSQANYATSSLTNGQIVNVIVTNSTGCSATSTGIANFVNAVPTANAGTGGNECDLNFSLKAIPSIGFGTWTKAEGSGTATFNPNPNTANATVTVSDYGTYSFTWTEVNTTCTSISTVTVNFYNPPVANPGTGGNNCGSDFFLNAVPSVGVGTWTKTAGSGTATFTPNPNNPNAKVVVSAYGQYTFTWTEVNGICSNSASVNVTFIQAPVADAGTGGEVCGHKFNLNAKPSSSAGTWTKFAGPGNAVFTPDANHPDAVVEVDKDGLYTFAWTEVNSTCQSTDQINVTFHDFPQLSASRDTVICKGRSVQLKATGSGLYLWAPGTSLNDTIISNPIATPLKTTVYKVTLTNQFGCKSTDSIKVEVREIPVANAGPDQTLEYFFSSTLQANEPGNYETGVWSVIAGSALLQDTTNPMTSVSELSLDENTFVWKVSNGVCPSISDTVTITVNNLKIPTLITPNMDGKNDYFVIRGLGTLGKTELIIFDRRGAQVYKNENYDNSWNGVDYNGNPLPDDTYFYVIRAQNVKYGKSLSGYIVIRR